ncbi:hypothetical protein BJ322DRAFT_798049 [Thelephora terrestris]|uniref:4a-hydroxytetrahydrobiopterin dehydratase n=1 Tax=Thelephora terrestris TaxID=56493 RepID=A0A9P6HGK6_9AGAM|nr:hypothetical protein BJ322DRAFT_798049 [Thelephora terrestris]
MNFALRPRPPLPSGRVLASRCPHRCPLGGSLSFPARIRRISSQSAPENTHVASVLFPPLPKSLPEPPAYPCPHLTNFDALKPLYQRHWKVCASYNNAREVKTEALEKKFTLTKYRHTLEFFNDVMGLQGICAQEKHHPIGVRFTFMTLTFSLKTSNAVPAQSSSDASRSPGITLRDMRLATLIEKHFEDKFVSSGHGLESTDPPDTRDQPSDPTGIVS